MNKLQQTEQSRYSYGQELPGLYSQPPLNQELSPGKRNFPKISKF